MASRSPATNLMRIHALQDQLTSSPWSHDVLELAMATAIATPLGDDNSAPVWLLVVGVPSGDKTATVTCVAGATILWVDSFTENALASGYAPEKVHHRKPDLLQQIARDGVTCLAIKDLTTLFSLKDDRVKKVLGELQTIYDGAYAKATGTVGVLQYRPRFGFLGCITPIALAHHHRYISMIGSRFLAYRVPRLTEAERAEGFDRSWGQVDRAQLVRQLRDRVRTH